MAPHFYGPGVFFFNDTATTEIYTLSLHDALPIYAVRFDAHAACHAPSPHGYGERVLARLDIRNGEVLPVVGVGVIVLAVRFGVGVGRLLRLCLDQPEIGRAHV